MRIEMHNFKVNHLVFKNERKKIRVDPRKSATSGGCS